MVAGNVIVHCSGSDDMSRPEVVPSTLLRAKLIQNRKAAYWAAFHYNKDVHSESVCVDEFLVAAAQDACGEVVAKLEVVGCHQH